jgi:hypothetical protein
MVKSSSLDVECGCYSYSLSGPPPIASSSTPDGTDQKCLAEKSNHLGFDCLEAIDTIIPQFCTQAAQLLKKTTKLPTLDFRSKIYPETVVNVAITDFTCGSNTGVSIGEDRCKHLLGRLADSCTTNTITDRMGGILIDQCITYSIKSSQPQTDFVHGTCSVGITQYYDGTKYSIDAVFKDVKGGLLTQCTGIGEKADIDKAILCRRETTTSCRRRCRLPSARTRTET